MKKSPANRESHFRRPKIEAVSDEELAIFLRILSNLSGTLRDLGYPEEGEMLMGVRLDLEQRIQETGDLPN